MIKKIMVESQIDNFTTIKNQLNKFLNKRNVTTFREMN